MLNRHSAVPLHHQFKRMLLDQMARGDLPPGARLPTEREYAARYGISLAPVRQALGDLAKQGYLERIKSRGTFVRGHKLEQKITALSSFTDSMQHIGLPLEVQVLCLKRGRPSKELAARLRRPPAQHVVTLQRRCLVEGEPAALLFSYLPCAVFPGLERHDFTNRSLYHVLEDEYGCVLTRAESYIEVQPADEETAAHLSVPGGAPLLRVEGVTYRADEDIVEYAEVLYRADRYRFLIESRREPSGVVTAWRGGHGGIPELPS